MPIQEQIELCTTHYQKWKSLALSVRSTGESKVALERAFFWLELQTAFITLFTMEKLQGNSPEVKLRIIAAKANLSKRLADYADSILNELNY